MEDNLKKNIKNERRPPKKMKWKMTSIFVWTTRMTTYIKNGRRPREKKMEDDFKKNGRRPQNKLN